jgi:hypothetical protein
MSYLYKFQNLPLEQKVKLQWFAAIILGLLYVLATAIVPGPDDLYRYYLPFANGCTKCGFVPYYAQWFLWPLTILPRNVVWPIWTFFTISVILFIQYTRKTNPVPLLLSFPMMTQFWLGQIDALVALGLALVMGYFGNRPFIKGIGILIALIKPQLSLPALLFILWYWNWDERLKVGIVVVIGFAVSLWQYGLTWPVEWLTQAKSLGVHLWRQPSTLLFPFGLITLLIPLFLSEPSKKIQAALVSSAFIPQHSIYSHLVFLAFLKPSTWWVIPISLLWLLFVPVLGTNATMLSMLLPLAILFRLLWNQRRQMREGGKNNTTPYLE